MTNNVIWKVAAPVLLLGGVLLTLGIAAAWNVHNQQKVNSDLISREVKGMIAIEELHLGMREIRYQINLYLRTLDSERLKEVAALHQDTDRLLATAKRLAQPGEESEVISRVALGYNDFFTVYQGIADQLVAASVLHAPSEPHPIRRESLDQLAELSDEMLSKNVLAPLRKCLAIDQQVVERTNAASKSTTQHLKIGFVLLGVCGAAAGLLTGIGFARGIRRSIVQLDVSFRGVAGKLSRVTGPIEFTHRGDLQGIGQGLQQIEEDIAGIVERLQKSEIEVLRSEQLARVGQLAAGLAHELRNPLMPMKMLVQAAMERKDEIGLRGRSLMVINDEIIRMEKSIQTFLDFARPPDPEKSHVDLIELVYKATELVQMRAVSQRVEIEFQFESDLLQLYADRGQLHQLVLNLLLNALDEMPDGGKIEISVAKMLVDETPSVRLSVSDSGHGISAEIIDQIFEPFLTTKETGTGLGLSICQRIATTHHGNLTAKNRLPNGAEFTLVLPFEKADLAESKI